MQVLVKAPAACEKMMSGAWVGPFVLRKDGQELEPLLQQLLVKMHECVVSLVWKTWSLTAGLAQEAKLGGYHLHPSFLCLGQSKVVPYVECC